MGVLAGTGAQTPAKIILGMINKLVVTDAGGVNPVVFGSIKNVNVQNNETRYQHTDNATVAEVVRDIITGRSVTISFDMEEWSDDNMEIVTGFTKDAEGRFFPGASDVPEKRFEFYHQDPDNGTNIFALVVPKAKIAQNFTWNFGGGAAVPWPITINCLKDTDGTFFAPDDPDGNPAVFFIQTEAETAGSVTDTYGIAE